jgi:alcohol dehydrogenase (cytochrome c)
MTLMNTTKAALGATRCTVRNALFAAALVVGAVAGLHAQNLEPGGIEHPSPDSWPLYHGDYSGRRHSALKQITPQNVGNLGLSWIFQTHQNAAIKSSPLLVDGILYFTVPDNVWAVDARSGHQVWHYHRPSTQGEHIGHRGVAMYKGWLYFTTPDCHLISLEAKSGRVRFDKVIADVNRGYWMTMAPLVVRNHVVVGVSGDFDNLPGYLRSIDPETGETQWQWDATPPAGTPNATTGGMTWMTGTYDPELNLIYWGTGNPTPVLNGNTPPGDNPWNC